MIDKQLIQELAYNDFLPIFSDMEKCFKRLDSMDIRLVVGDRPVDLLEDKFIRLVLATFQALEK